MPKMTLLDMTQDILSDLTSDNVNSISDTVESEQVAQIIKTTYFAMIDEYHLPAKRSLFKLDATGTSTPTQMTIPANVESVDWIRYNKETVDATDAAYADVIYLTPEEFTAYCDQRSESADNITLYTIGGVDMLIRTDAAPTYYTSFDDQTIVMDSFDSDVDTNLQQSKTKCYGLINATWTHTDSAYPDLPLNMFSLLLSEAKSKAFYLLKQTANQKEEQGARRQRIALRKAKTKTKEGGGIPTPNYGRK